MKNLYWRFIKYMNYDLRDNALTASGWLEAKKKFRKNAPIRFFIMETVPDVFDSAWAAITRPFRNAYWFVYHRTIERSHVVKTSLKPGYYDKDIIMLHACFKLLADYVEIELAVMEFHDPSPRDKRLVNSIKRKNKWIPFHNARFRSSYLGVRHLEKNIAYSEESLKGLAKAYKGEVSNEVIETQERLEKDRTILELYKWWTEERPRAHEDHENAVFPRHDEIDKASEGKGGLYVITSDFDKEYPELSKAYHDFTTKRNQVEELLVEEDAEKLQQLMEIRTSLWT